MLFDKNIQKISALDSSEPYDVCIIGSGPAGTILGRSLAEKGIRTVILESGTGLFRWVFDLRLRKLATHQFTGDTHYPLYRTRARLRGGTSTFWTGRCERYHPSDFANNPYTPPDNPWPFTYSEIEPYYERAERVLRVRGNTPSRFAQPRANPFPLQSSKNISYLKSLGAKAGVTIDDSPTATPTKGMRFFWVQDEILPGFLASPYSTMICGATVTRLLNNHNKRIVGAEVRTMDGTKKTVRAKIYVVACGGIESPRLLLLSRSEQFPNGIGNRYDRVGRGFNDHPAVNFYAKLRHTWDTIYPSNKIGRSHQFYDHFRSQGLGSMLLVFRQAWFFPHHTMPLNLANIPKNLIASISRITRPTLYIGATIGMKISDGNRVMLSDHMKDRFGDPMAHLIFNFSEEDRRTLDCARKLIREIYDKLGASDIVEADVCFSYHHQGTCRMGENPKTSVCDANLRVHETPNLYTLGCETFVTGGAIQPLLTIAALSYRLSDHLVSRFQNEEL